MSERCQRKAGALPVLAPAATVLRLSALSIQARQELHPGRHPAKTAAIVKGNAAEVIPLTCNFDEIHVFDGVAERTGTQFDRAGVRGQVRVCRSLRDLGAKARRLGDGYYYLASAAWPADTVTVSLSRSWTPVS